jgi:hypothetical protein
MELSENQWNSQKINGTLRKSMELSGADRSNLLSVGIRFEAF